jgi:predicted transcriptional regulator
MATDLQKVIKQLIKAGFTEKELADKAGCAQPTIHRIKKGEIKNPGFSIGSALQSVHAEHFKQQAQA